MNKAESEKKHCIRRLRERFGREDYDEILKAIQQGEAEFIYRQSNTRAIFKIGELYAVYNRLRKTVITVMTEEMMA